MKKANKICFCGIENRNFKFIQLEKILTLYHQKPCVLAQVLSLKQGKNFAFVNQSFQALITQF